ncbi:hypothetical protein [Vibrio harveyi]|uniref:hypothetical protein n=1 Tax=Vibrio harveyi TaxID=669 RepID=UPI001F162863|nr:hypothetical protein [Vibrio harveyi]
MRSYLGTSNINNIAPWVHGAHTFLSIVYPKISFDYDALGRMQYHPDFHPNHGLPWKTTEQKYLIERYVLDGPE